MTTCSRYQLSINPEVIQPYFTFTLLKFRCQKTNFHGLNEETFNTLRTCMITFVFSGPRSQNKLAIEILNPKFSENLADLLLNHCTTLRCRSLSMLVCPFWDPTKTELIRTLETDVPTTEPFGAKTQISAFH